MQMFLTAQKNLKNLKVPQVYIRIILFFLNRKLKSSCTNFVFLCPYLRPQKLPVHPCNILNRNFFRAFRLTGSCIGAVAETQLVHFSNHSLNPACSFGSALW